MIVLLWSPNIIGGPGVGGRCVLKIKPLHLQDERDWDWGLVASGSWWKTTGRYLWSRSSQAGGGFIIRVLELDTRETWQVFSAAMFIYKVKIFLSFHPISPIRFLTIPYFRQQIAICMLNVTTTVCVFLIFSVFIEPIPHA